MNSYAATLFLLSAVVTPTSSFCPSFYPSNAMVRRSGVRSSMPMTSGDADVDKTTVQAKDFPSDDPLMILNRRTALTSLLTIPHVVASLSSSPAIAAPSDVCTVVVDSPKLGPQDVGIEFEDIKLNEKEVPSVKEVKSGSSADKNGVKAGMILISRNSATKSSTKNIELRIRNGPFPFIMQFATPEMMESEMMKLRVDNSGPPPVLGMEPYGQLNVKRVKGPQESCGSSMGARRGDTVTITYEARIGSEDGPIYDTTEWRQGKPVTFQLGKNYALLGVETGMNGMCIGEVREINLPTQMGYGRYGSQVFDIPGDTRLWWHVELLKLDKGNQRK